MPRYKFRSHKEYHPNDFPVKVLGPFAWINQEKFYLGTLNAYANTRIDGFWKRPFSHDFKYQFNFEYRLGCEIDAMAAYLKEADPLWYPAQVDYLARVLAKKCKINIHEAFRLISNL